MEAGLRKVGYRGGAGWVRLAVRVPLAILARGTAMAGVSVVACCVASTARAADVWQERQKLEAAYEQHLADLATWCEEHSQGPLAERTRAWIQQPDAQRLVLVALGPQGLPSDAAPPGDVAQWQARWLALRRAQADAWFELARRAIRGRHVSLAYELVLAAVRENPDHEAARRLLGYVRQGDRWRTPYELRQERLGRQWHDRFGWLPRGHAGRYEQGERFFNGRWIPAAEEAQRRAAIDQGWQVETEHYLVTTNHSLEAGVALGQRLERLHQVWRQVFARYYISPDQLSKLFESRASPRAGTARHAVVYFRNRDEYNEALAGTIVADIRITTGLYLNQARHAYFFASEQDHEDASTLYHEATHQLFSETRPAVAVPGAAANFWVIEGVACYMESLAEMEGAWSLGGADAVRRRDARFRLLGSPEHQAAPFYVPMAQLAARGAGDVQRSPEIAKLYSQAAGWVHYLMHAHEGRARDTLLEYLVAVYTGRDRPSLLAELSGHAFEELDRDYYRFLAGAEPPDDWPPPASASATPVGTP